MNVQKNGKDPSKERYSFEDLRQQCIGQWPSIIAALSHADVSDALAKIGKHVRCHNDHGNTKQQFRLYKDFAETGGGVCNTCGSSADGFAMFDYLNGWDRKTAVREVANYLRDRGYRPAKSQKAPTPPPRRALVVNDDHSKALKKV